MVTIKDMNEAESSQELADFLIEKMGDKEYMTVSTCPCDMYGWSRQTHAFMQKVQRKNMMKGVHISCKYSFEVYDWTFVKE